MSEQLIKTPGVFGENGNFLLERELGSGGMGGVYMGRDKMLDRPVAVKVMLKEYGSDAEFVEKFKKEAQSVARLIHPNIAQIYSYGICDGMPYMAMELASGGSLYSIMNANPGKTDIARVIKICQQVAQALQCASDQGFVHGDVKPENILLDANGNAKLVDFGLAAMQKDTSEIWGTPYYISPEKVKKELVDFRSDMYSLGGTLYHALTGVAPFEGEDSIAVVKKRFDGAPKKPSEIRPEISAPIDELVMKMLSLEKEDRYPSFEALLDAFKTVLTSGLTAKLPSASALSSGAGASDKKTTAGVRRMTTVRGRRAMMKKRPTSVVKKKLEGEEGDEGAVDEDEKPAPTDEDEEEGGGHLGLKVVGVVLGVVLLVGGVIGGLVWYQIADKKARAADAQAQIVGGIGKARAAIRDTVASALKFSDEFDAFAAKAITECQKPTDDLKKILPEDQGCLLKPGLSKELLDAIASTNEAPKAVESPSPAATTNAPAATATATNAPAAKAPAQKPAVTNVSAKTTSPASAAAKDKKDDAKKDSQTPQVVIAMNELWERAYGCQASAIRIRQSVRQIVNKSAEADALKDETQETMTKLAELSRTLVDMLEQLKVSKDVENVRKGITFIKTKGEKTVEQTVKRLRIEKLEADRKAKAEAVAAADKARQEKLAEEKKQKIEEESAAAKSKFEAIVMQGCVRQLDWKSSLRQLDGLKAEMTTPEGSLAVDLEIRKVNDMKKVHDLFIKQFAKYTFTKSRLKGARVTKVNEKEIHLERDKKKLKVTWQKFFNDDAHTYYSNLIEVLNRFVFNGRKNCGLSQKDVADVLTGGALLLQNVCSEGENASVLAEKLAKEAVKQFPEYQKTASEIFPDIKFEETEE